MRMHIRITTTVGVAVLAAIGLSPTAVSATTPRCDGLRATIVSPDTTSTVVGTARRDVIVATGSNDVTALGGDDVVCSPGGGTIDLGEGNDRTTVTGQAYEVSGGPGHDVIRAHGSLRGVRGDEGNDYVQDAFGFVPTQGGDGDDVLVGLDGATLIGGPGRDISYAGRTGGVVMLDDPGPDLYYGAGNVGNVVSYGSSGGPVRVDLAAHRTTGAGNGGATDLLIGVRAVAGGPYADTLLGDDHANRIIGLLTVLDEIPTPERAGADRIDARGGNDDVRAAGPGTTVVAGDGDDVVDTTGAMFESAATTVHGGRGDDRLSVDGRAFGGPGADTLVGDGYDDVLIGDAGRDSADGSGGTDRCVAETTQRCELP